MGYTYLNNVSTPILDLCITGGPLTKRQRRRKGCIKNSRIYPNANSKEPLIGGIPKTLLEIPRDNCNSKFGRISSKISLDKPAVKHRTLKPWSRIYRKVLIRKRLGGRRQLLRNWMRSSRKP